jgi:hypothetical protein
VQPKKLVASKNPWILFLASHTKRDNELYKDFVKRMAVLYNSMEGKAKNEIIEIPKPEFDKEHKELIKVLASGTDKEQKTEAKKQLEELEAQEKKDKQKAEGLSLYKQYIAQQDQKDKEARYIEPYNKTIRHIKYYSEPENWEGLTTKERQDLYSNIDHLDYIQKQVPEVGKNPYPDADSLPYIKMRRGYKLWLNKRERVVTSKAEEEEQKKGAAEKQEKEVERQKWLQHYGDMTHTELNKLDNSNAKIKMTTVELYAFLDVLKKKGEEAVKIREAREKEEKEAASAKIQAKLTTIVDFYKTLTEKSKKKDVEKLEEMIQNLAGNESDESVTEAIKPMVKWIFEWHGLVKAKKYNIRNGVTYYCHYCSYAIRFDNLMTDNTQDVECFNCGLDDEIRNWYRKPPASKKT